MSGVWSKFKKRVEAMWVEDLDMVIHCTAYTHHTNHSKYDIQRYWIVLNGEMIWDFPGPFVDKSYYGKAAANQTRLPLLRYWLDNISFATPVLDEYLSRSKETVFEPIVNDEWELGDIMRAADRRLGKAKLIEWGKTLDPANPALAVLRARYPKEGT